MFCRLAAVIVSGDCYWKRFVDCCCCNSFWRLLVLLKMFCRLAAVIVSRNYYSSNSLQNIFSDSLQKLLQQQQSTKHFQWVSRNYCSSNSLQNIFSESPETITAATVYKTFSVTVSRNYYSSNSLQNGNSFWRLLVLLKMFCRLAAVIVSGDCYWKRFVDCCCCNSFWRLSLKMFCRLLLL
jgi:Na+-transporting NADH:ubiquinone oxidoreductase subunit NqrC